MAIFLWEMHPALWFYRTRSVIAVVPILTVNLDRGCSSIVNQTITLPVTWESKFPSAHAHEVPFRYKGPPLRISSLLSLPRFRWLYTTSREPSAAGSNPLFVPWVGWEWIYKWFSAGPILLWFQKAAGLLSTLRSLIGFAELKHDFPAAPQTTSAINGQRAENYSRE